MISNKKLSKIYIPTLSIYQQYEGEGLFYEFIIDTFHTCTADHFLKNMKFISLEFKQDKFIDAFLEHIIKKDLDDINQLKEKGLSIDKGYYLLTVESEYDYTRRSIPEIEFIFQKLCEEYKFISSFQYYLNEDSVACFCKMHTFESNVETDDFPDLSEYAPLLDGYFYDGIIPDDYADVVAKIILLQEDVL